MNIQNDIDQLEVAVAALSRKQIMTVAELYKRMKGLWQDEAGPGEMYSVIQDFDTATDYHFRGDPILIVDGVTIDPNGRYVNMDVRVRLPETPEHVDVNIAV